MAQTVIEPVAGPLEMSWAEALSPPPPPVSASRPHADSASAVVATRATAKPDVRRIVISLSSGEGRGSLRLPDAMVSRGRVGGRLGGEVPRGVPGTRTR